MNDPGQRSDEEPDFDLSNMIEILSMSLNVLHANSRGGLIIHRAPSWTNNPVGQNAC